MDNVTTANLGYVKVPEVTYEPYPPTTGSQRCLSCSGWIGNISYYYASDGPYCPPCWRAKNEEDKNV